MTQLNLHFYLEVALTLPSWELTTILNLVGIAPNMFLY